MLPIHPKDSWLLGMQWEGMLFKDATLPFSLRSAPKIFIPVANALKWIVRQEGVCTIMHYLNNFLLIGAPGGHDCVHSLRTFLSTFKSLGVPVTWDELEGPVTALTFLSIQIDSQALQLRLLEAKLVELQQLISMWKGKRSCTSNRRCILHCFILSVDNSLPGSCLQQTLTELLQMRAKHLGIPGEAVTLLNMICCSSVFANVVFALLSAVSFSRLESYAPVHCF